MIKYNYETNPNWENLNLPQQGDMVELKLTTTTHAYCAAFIVSEVNSYQIIGQGKALLGWKNGETILSGDIHNVVVDKQIEFMIDKVHQVIKKPI